MAWSTNAKPSTFAPWLVGLGVLAVHAGCGSSSQGNPGSGSESPANSGAGESSGNQGGGSSSGMVGGSSGVAGSGGTITGSSGTGSSGASSSGVPNGSSGATSSSGATGILVSSDGGMTSDGASSGAEGGSATDSGAAPCQTGAMTACTTFETAPGMVLQLGPYGAKMDENVGTGFKNAVQSGDVPANASTCQSFVNGFGQDAKLNAQLLQTTNNGVTLDFSLYTVYRPATWPDGPVPVISWGNGTCAQPEGYGALLRYVASYGYFVVAANSRWVGSGTPAPMLHALDYAAAANTDSTSPYYQKLDMTKVGAMGHSQGGEATASAANDSRVLDVIIFNAVDSGVAKPYLSISGDLDITGFTAASMASAIDLATQPAAYIYEHNPVGMGSYRGHLVLMLSPERLTGLTVAWWQMMFRKDTASHGMFVGASCGLCATTSDYAYGANSLLK